MTLSQILLDILLSVFLAPQEIADKGIKYKPDPHFTVTVVDWKSLQISGVRYVIAWDEKCRFWQKLRLVIVESGKKHTYFTF